MVGFANFLSGQSCGLLAGQRLQSPPGLDPDPPRVLRRLVFSGHFLMI